VAAILPYSRRITVGAGKALNAKDFVVAARALNVTPHITANHRLHFSRWL